MSKHKALHRRRRPSVARTVLVALFGATLVSIMSACAVSTPVDQAAVIYKDGYGDKKFDKCVPAGKRVGVGANIKEYRYPVNSRDYQFAGPEVAGRERGPIEVLAKNGIKMTVSGAVYFTLNDNCDVLRQFHEQVGTNYEPSGDGLVKWDEMLAKYIGVPVENALDRVSLDYSIDDLTGNATKKNEWQAAAAKQITDSINQVTGGQAYFCKPGFKGDGKDTCGQFSISLNQAQPPSNITDANSEAAAQAKRNTTATSSAETQKTLIALYGVQGYIQMQQIDLMRQALAKGNIPFLPVPAGGTVNYTPVK